MWLEVKNARSYAIGDGCVGFRRREDKRNIQVVVRGALLTTEKTCWEFEVRGLMMALQYEEMVAEVEGWDFLVAMEPDRPSC